MRLDMQKKMDAMKVKLIERSEEDELKGKTLGSAVSAVHTVQRSFSGWEDETRAAPNALLRGALFSATQGRSKWFYERELIATLDNYEIRYTGLQLTQLDLNLWETILHMSRNNPLGHEASFSIYDILKRMGRGRSVRDYDRLKRSLARLRSADVEVTIKGKKTYFGALCGIAGELDEKTDSYKFKFSEGLICLFDNGWSKLDYQHRRALRDKPLALWLQGLFSSHARPYPIKVETIHRLCGSDTKEIRYFKARLTKALEELVSVGCLTDFSIKDGLLKVKKKPSKSQVKHIVKKGLLNGK